MCLNILQGTHAIFYTRRVARDNFQKYFIKSCTKTKIDPIQNNTGISRELRPPFVFSSGAIYTGEWKGAYRDGKGTQQWPDGAKYIGYWIDNRAEGKGKFIHIDGDIYEGTSCYTY